MEDLRTPCVHRGGADVVETLMPGAEAELKICICKNCRRFWLERRGWLLSRRETLQVLRDWPFDAQVAEPAR
ncbi:MAG: hypothetical protein HY775_06170 [Acidobacteria bacterium]|nr:hypothetical protein [Acidobacteriota bacterium]